MASLSELLKSLGLEAPEDQNPQMTDLSQVQSMSDELPVSAMRPSERRLPELPATNPFREETPLPPPSESMTTSLPSITPVMKNQPNDELMQNMQQLPEASSEEVEPMPEAQVAPEAEMQKESPKDLQLPQSKSQLPGFGNDLGDQALADALAAGRSRQDKIRMFQGLTGLVGGLTGSSGKSAFLDDLSKSSLAQYEDLQARRKGKDQELDFAKNKINTETLFEDTKAMRDPNSLQSQVYRQAAQEFGLPGVPENANAASLEKVLPLLKKRAADVANRYVKLGTAQDGSALLLDKTTGETVKTEDKLADNIFTSKDPSTGEVNLLGRRGGILGKIGGAKELPQGSEMSREQLNPNQRKAVDSNRADALKDPLVKSVRESLAEVSQAKNLVEKNIPGSAGAIKRSLLKMFESGGRFTDQDVQQFGGPQDHLSNLDRMITLQTTKKGLTTSDQKYLRQLLSVLERENKSKAESSSAYYVDDLVKRGLPQDFAKKEVTDFLIPGQKDISSKVGKAKQEAPKQAQSKPSVKLPPNANLKAGTVFTAKGKQYKVNEDGKTASEL